MSQNVEVFFDKDVIIIKPLKIAVPLMKIAFWGRYNAFWKTADVALQKLLKGGRGMLHDCLRLPRLLTTNNRQLEILVTTLTIYKFSCQKFKCGIETPHLAPQYLYFVRNVLKKDVLFSAGGRHFNRKKIYIYI